MAGTPTDAGLKAELLRYHRKVKIYERIGKIYMRTGFAVVILLFIVALAWWYFTGGRQWPLWLENAVGVFLIPGALVTFAGKMIRVFWWPILESQRQDLEEEIKRLATC